MFYCTKCAEDRKWPETMFKSRGKCETCGEVAVCNEMASKNLPVPASFEEEDDEPAVEIKNFRQKRHSQQPSSAMMRCPACADDTCELCPDILLAVYGRSIGCTCSRDKHGWLLEAARG